jgi:hypothetical protein
MAYEESVGGIYSVLSMPNVEGVCKGTRVLGLSPVLSQRTKGRVATRAFRFGCLNAFVDICRVIRCVVLAAFDGTTRS